MADPKPQNTLTVFFAENYEAATGLHKPTLEKLGFSSKTGAFALLPQADGTLIAFYCLGLAAAYDPLSFRTLTGSLPEGAWVMDAPTSLDRFALHRAFGIGLYAFTAFKQSAKPKATTLIDPALDEDTKARVTLALKAEYLVRDLVNRPANDLGPVELGMAAQTVATECGAECKIISGDDLLTQNYPAIHAVGRAAGQGREPRLVEITWSHKSPQKHVVLVGKGITFDTGGLDIKPASGMGLMKKDMGGAAHALALGEWMMRANLPIQLTVLLAVAENAISGNAMRPSDVIASRAGLSIEVGNTDAEGRLVLADALTRASELSPDLTIDFATLTGAARVALGPELVPFYTEKPETLRGLLKVCDQTKDRIWPMPLWAGYESALDSEIADIKNDPSSWSQAGSVMAALFLKRFAPRQGVWIHYDIYAHNPRARAGFPTGAEAQALLVTYEFVKDFL